MAYVPETKGAYTQSGLAPAPGYSQQSAVGSFAGYGGSYDRSRHTLADDVDQSMASDYAMGNAGLLMPELYKDGKGGPLAKGGAGPMHALYSGMVAQMAAANPNASIDMVVLSYRPGGKGGTAIAPASRSYH